MHAIDMIGEHLSKDYLNNLPLKIHTGIDSICTFTGNKINEGVLKKDLIKDVFTDYEYLKYKSDYCSLNAAMCLQRVIPNEKGTFVSLRNFSFLCTKDSLKRYKREELEDVFFNLPNQEFIFVVTFNYKKHTTFKAKVNTSKKDFIITTDKGNIAIDMSKVNEIYPILKNWYTVISEKKDTNIKPTCFTKSDILHGCNNYKKIEEYGEKYFIEDKTLSKYRDSLFLELLVYILNKEEN